MVMDGNSSPTQKSKKPDESPQVEQLEGVNDSSHIQQSKGVHGPPLIQQFKGVDEAPLMQQLKGIDDPPQTQQLKGADSSPPHVRPSKGFDDSPYIQQPKGMPNTHQNAPFHNGNGIVSLDEDVEGPPAKTKHCKADAAIQVSSTSRIRGDFTFSCVWDKPKKAKRARTHRNASLQCNITNGWLVGVPKIMSESLNHSRRNMYNSNLDNDEPPMKIQRIKEDVLTNGTNDFPDPSIPSSSVKPVVGASVLDDSPNDDPIDKKSFGVQCSLSSSSECPVKSKSTQVHLPIESSKSSSWSKERVTAEIACRSNPLAKKDMQNDDSCLGFHGYSSIRSGIDSKLRSLCGIGKSTFDYYLNKMNHRRTHNSVSKETALLVLLMKLKLGLSFANLAIFFGLESLVLSQIFKDALDQVLLCRTEILWPTLDATNKELPSYFGGIYKETRVILVCYEVETGQPEDEQHRYNLFSSTSRKYSYKFVLGMTPLGKICFKSKPFEGRKSFKRVLKACGFLSNLKPKELVLTNAILPEMEFMVKKGVLLMAPQASSYNSSDDEGNVKRHIERCEQRLHFFKSFEKLPISLSARIDDVALICCSLVNELRPILRYDQPEDEEL